MKVALVFLPSWLPHSPPLGISSVSSYLRTAGGHDVAVFDRNAGIWARMKPKQQELWFPGSVDNWLHQDKFQAKVLPLIRADLFQLTQELAASGFDAIGFSIYSSNYFPTRLCLGILRQLVPDVKLFYGGASSTHEKAQEDLRAGLIDAAVCGEGEASSLELINAWATGLPLNDEIDGVVFRREGTIVRGKKRQPLSMSGLPFPDFSGYPFARFERRVVPIEFSRGCVANCAFCSETNRIAGFRTKSVSRIVDEMRFMIQNLGAHEFRVVDSLINGNFRQLLELADTLIRENLGIHWGGFFRVDPRLTPEVLARLHRSGCRYISFGLESGSQRVLDLMNKKIKVEDSYAVVKNAAAAGIQVSAEILVGFPGERLEDFVSTLTMMKHLHKDISRVSTGHGMQIIEGTAVYDDMKDFDVVRRTSRDWNMADGSNTLQVRTARLRVLRGLLKRLRIEDTFCSQAFPQLTPQGHVLQGATPVQGG